MLLEILKENLLSQLFCSVPGMLICIISGQRETEEFMENMPEVEKIFIANQRGCES